MKLDHDEYVKAFKGIQAPEEIKQTVLNEYRRGRSQKKNQMFKKSLRLAAAFILILLLATSVTAVAKVFHINEIFRYFFKEPVTLNDPAGTANSPDTKVPDTTKLPSGTEASNPKDTVKTKPAGEDNEFLAKAGTILEQKVTGNGLIITVRGLVGDRNSVYIAFDVETEDGKAFREEQENALNSYTFDKVFLQIDDLVLGQYTNAYRIDDGKQTGKATFLIDETISGDIMDNITGHVLTLTLTDLKKQNDEMVTLTMPGDIREILHQFEEPREGDYFHYGYSSTEEGALESLSELRNKYSSGEIAQSDFTDRLNEMKKSGDIIESYVLKKTPKEVSFTEIYPKLTVNNMGIIEDSLYVNLNLHGEFTEKELNNKRLLLVNKKNGSISRTGIEKVWLLTKDIDGLKGNEEQADIVDGQAVSVRYMLSGIKDENALQDIVFAYGGAGSYDTVYEGRWQFRFDLNYEDTTSVISFKDVTLENAVKLDTLELSPVSLAVSLKYLNQDHEDFKTNYLELELKDGSKIPVNNYRYNSDKDNNTVECKALLPLLIKTDQVVSLRINDTVIKLHKN